MKESTVQMKPARFNAMETQHGWVVVNSHNEVCSEVFESEWGCRGKASRMNNQSNEGFSEVTGTDIFKVIHMG